MRTVTWSPDGAMVAVGYGGRTGSGRSRRDGAFVLLKAPDLSVVHEGQDSRDWLTEIKFSPDGTMMAAASQVRGRGMLSRVNSLFLACDDDDDDDDSLFSGGGGCTVSYTFFP